MSKIKHAKTPASTPWLDKALEGQPPETKARVLDIILKHDIDPDDPFFVIFAALGQLQVLIEDSPKDWQTLFQSFQQEMQQWTQTNLATLQLLASKAETTEQLCQTSKQLTTTLTELVKISSAMIMHLQSYDQGCNDWQPVLKHFEHKLSSCMDQLNNQIAASNLKLETQDNTLQRLYQQQTAQHSIWSWSSQRLKMGLTVCSLIGVVGILGVSLSQQQQLADTGQQVEWLLKKANRADCQSGVKAATSLECRGL